MRAPSPENRVFMGAVMAVAGAYPEGTVIAPNIEGELRAPAAHVAQETRAQAAYRLAWEERLQQAHQARRATAGRYTSCAVTDVVDSHISQHVQGTEYTPRNEVIVTVAATITPEAAAAEATYDNGQPRANDVTWQHFSMGGNAQTRRTRDVSEPTMVLVPTQSQAEQTGPNQEAFTVRAFPRVDKNRTTNLTITLDTVVETGVEAGPPGMEDNTRYRTFGSIVCGQLVEVTGDNGQPEWRQVAPGPNPAQGVYTFEEQLCEYVPISDDGVMYDLQCS